MCKTLKCKIVIIIEIQSEENCSFTTTKQTKDPENTNRSGFFVIFAHFQHKNGM